MAKAIAQLTLAESRALVNAVQKKLFGRDTDVRFVNNYLVEAPIINFVSTGSIWTDLAIAYPKGAGVPMPGLIEIGGEESSGKAQPLTSKLLTPAGWTTFGHVQIGDTIQGKQGWTTVLMVHPVVEQDVYQITFCDGSVVECAASHLWTVQTRKRHKKAPWYTKETFTFTAAELLKRGLKDPGIHNGYRWSIPMLAEPVDYGFQDPLPIEPYSLGLLIGNGGFTNTTPRFSSNEFTLVNALCLGLGNDVCVIAEPVNPAHPNKRDWSLSSGVRGGGTGNGPPPNPLRKKLEALGLYWHKSIEKFIPVGYQKAAPEDRLALLQGLMDTDGTVAHKTGHVSYSTGSYRLAADVQSVVQSLGGVAPIFPKMVDGVEYYNVNVRLPERFPPFRLVRKKALTWKRRNPPRRRIESIIPVRRKPCRCITVAAEDGLYATDHYVLTHNSALAYTIAGNVQRLGGWVLLMDEEDCFNADYGRLAKLYLDADRFQWGRADNIEKCFACIRETAQEHFRVAPHIPFCAILDSVAGVATKEEETATWEEKAVRRASHAAIIAQELRVMQNVMSNNPFLLILINQLKSTMAKNPWEPKLSAFGGKAIKYHARIRLEVKKKTALTWHESDMYDCGMEMEINVIKNKIAAPWRDSKVHFLFESGIEDYVPIMDFLRHDKIKVLPKMGGGWYTQWDGKTWRAQELREYLIKTPESWSRMRSLLAATLAQLYRHMPIVDNAPDEAPEDVVGMFTPD